MYIIVLKIKMFPAGKNYKIYKQDNNNNYYYY